jgi:uncharacterized protein DUF5659
VKTFTQTFITDLHEAAVAKYAGYQVRWLANEQQWVAQNPGDLQDLLNDVRAGKQTVADALSFLKTYDEMRVISGVVEQSSSATQEVQTTPRQFDGRRWYTKDMRTAIFLKYAGYELLSTEDHGKTTFWFAHDEELDDLIYKFNRRELLVEPQAFHDTGFAIRNAMHEAKGYNMAERP